MEIFPEVDNTDLENLIVDEDWEKKRDIETKRLMDEIDLEYRSDTIDRIERQHRLYNTIEGLVELRLKNIILRLKLSDQSDIDRISLLDIARYFPSVFKDSREVTELKIGIEEKSRLNSLGAINQAEIVKDPELYKLFKEFNKHKDALIKEVERRKKVTSEDIKGGRIHEKAPLETLKELTDEVDEEIESSS